MITYTPEGDSDRRKRVGIDLVRLALQYNALESEDPGGYSSTSVDYQKERQRLLSTLSTRQRMLA
jgi:hypothetical protein